MNTSDLRNLQAPLKDKYRKEPNTAIITLKAKGEIAHELSCKVDTGRALVEAGLHPATGGDGFLACSGDLLLEALVACAGVTFSAVATALGVNFQAGTVKAEGDLDFRGTLGISKEVPVGFKAIRLYFEFNSKATRKQLESLYKLTERYCVVYQTIYNGVQVETNYKKT